MPRLEITWLGLLLAAVSCGRGQEETPSRERVNVSIAVEGSQGSFWLSMLLSPLTQATAFSAIVQGCASGWSAPVNAASGQTSVKMFKGDKGCYVALKSFTLGARTWLPSVGESFHRASEEPDTTTAVFRFDGGTEARVGNPDVLPDSLDEGATVLFRFEESNAGSDNSLLSKGVSGTLTGPENME